MPELPEVETMVRDLRERVPGRTIVDVQIMWDRLVRYPAPEVFAKSVKGSVVVDIRRRGKFALFDLQGDSILALHRGMTGSVFHRQSSAPMDRFVRARFGLDDGTELRFDDARKFGRLYWHDALDGNWQPPWLRLGREPLSEEFTTRELKRLLTGRRAAIKSLLLNQSIVAGVGNIYADEALFLARLHPARPGGSLTTRDVRRLCAAVPEVLRAAIEGRGTTFSNYRDIDGRSGTNQRGLMVFHRHGQPCPRCGQTLQRIVLGARGTHFCIACQR